MKEGRPDGELERAVEARRTRQAKWAREGERPLARNLALVGTLGWLIVVPALAGIFAGRALDRLAGTGVAFTCALMVAGVAIGGWFVWSRMRSA